jgi:hypothetical protein
MQIDGLQDREVAFEVRDFKRTFSVEGFLLSFSVPNFHFHATTAYDILRANGYRHEDTTQERSASAGVADWHPVLAQCLDSRWNFQVRYKRP